MNLDPVSGTFPHLPRLLVLLGSAGGLALTLFLVHPDSQAVQHPVPSLPWEKAKALHPLWIDARPREEFDASHLPGAFWLTEDDWHGGLHQLAPRLRPAQALVVYCGSGTCSSSYRVALRLKADLNRNDVYVLQGGWPPPGSMESPPP